MQAGLASPPIGTVTLTFKAAGQFTTLRVLGEFTNTGAGSCSSAASYAANDQCTVTVSFSPQQPGLRLGSVQLLDSNGVVLSMAHLSGWGLKPALRFLPSTTTVSGLDTNRMAYGLTDINRYYQDSKGVALDPAGNLLLSDTTRGKVYRLDTGTGYTQYGPLNVGSTQWEVGSGFTQPTGLAVDGAGNVYVVDSGAVKKIVANSAGQVSSTSTVISVGSGFSATMQHVAVDRKGNVYVADTGNNAVKEIVAGVNGVVDATSSVVTIASEITKPIGIAVDKNGILFVSDDAGLQKIVQGNPPTITMISAITSGGGLTFDAKGNLYMGDNADHGAGLYAPSYPFFTKFLAGGDGNIAVGATYRQPILPSSTTSPSPDVAVSGSGEIYVLNQWQCVTAACPYSIAAGAWVINFWPNPSLSFDSTLDGRTSSAKSVTVYNSGTAPLTFTKPVSGSNPYASAYFSVDTSSATTCPIVASTDTPGSLGVGGSCVVSSKFAPLPPSSGAQTGYLYINSDSSPTTQTVSLSGSAQVPTAQILQFLTPPAAAIKIGGNAGSAVTVAATDYAGNVAFDTTGLVTLTLTGTGISTPFSFTSSYLTNGVATFNLAAYARNTEGYYTYTAAITGGNQASTSTTLTTSAAAFEQVVGNSVTAGTVNTGQSSGSSIATLVFTSTATLRSIKVLTQGAPNLDYAYATGGSCTVGNTYAAGQSCTVYYTFTPKYPGRRNGAIVLVDQSGAAATQVYLTGVGNGGQASFTPGLLTTIAGNGSQGISGDGGAATQAKLYVPTSSVVDGAGNVYITEAGTHKVRRVDAVSGVISTVAGNGTSGFGGDGGAATSAQLFNPVGLALDGAGNLYIGDMYNNRIRRVDARSGVITTVAGSATSGYGGDGGLATSAKLNVPMCVALDGDSNLYICDTVNNRIRRVDANTGVITTVAGTGELGFGGDSGLATLAKLRSPEGLALDVAGNLYIADASNSRIRRVDAGSHIITTVAGSGVAGYAGDNGSAVNAQLNFPFGVAVDAAGDLYFAEANNHVVRRVDASTGVITTVAGSGVAGNAGDNGPANAAKLNQPLGVTLDAAGNLYVSDSRNNVLRTVTATAAPLDFGSVLQGASSSVQTVSMLNNGNAALSFPVPGAGKNPSLSAYFTLDSSGSTACPLLTSSSASAATLGVGVVCTLPVSFTPVTPADGNVSGSLIFTDNGPTATQSIALSGVATSPIPVSVTAAVSATTLYSPNAQSLSLSATVTSTGGAVNEGTVTFTVKDGATVIGAATTSATVNAGAAAVNYTLPAATAPKVYTVHAVYNQAASNPQFQASSDATHTLTVGKASQTLTVSTAAPASAAYQSSFTVAASSDSGLAVSYSASGGCTNSGAAFTMTSSTQACTVQIAQAGNANYNAATVVTQTVTATTATPVLGVSNLPASGVYNGGFIPTLSNSGTGVASLVSNTPTVCTAANGVVHYVGVGQCTLGISAPADGDYAASSTTVNIQISKASQTLTVSTPAPVSAAYQSSFTVAASSDSGLSVSYSASGGCTNNGAVFTMTSSTQACTVQIAQAGNANYNAAAVVTQTVTATKATPLLGVSNLPTSGAYNGGFTPVLSNSGTGAASLVSNTPTVCAYANGVVRYVGVGQCSLLVSAPADGDFAASSATVNIQVSKAAQTLTVSTPAPASAAFQSSFTVAASSDSGLAVSYSASGGCTNNGAVFTMTSSTQACTVQITQAGDAYYSAATAVSETVAAIGATPTLGISNLPTSAINGGLFTPILSNSGSGAASVVSNTPAVCTVTSGVVHYVGAGLCSLVISTPANGDYVAASTTLSFSVAKAASTVAVTASVNPALLSSSLTLTAQVSSLAGAPTGTVNFYDGAALIGSGALSGGQASLSIATLSVGAHSITAVYAGDANFVTSTSAALSQTVIDFAVSVPVSNGGATGATVVQTVAAGGTAAYTVQIAPTAGASFATVATLTITGQPAGSVITLTPTSWVQQSGNTWTLPANMPLTPVSISIQTPVSNANLNASNASGNGKFSFLWALLLLPFASKLRRAGKSLRRMAALLLLCAASASLLIGLSGCGAGNGFYAQAPKSYTVTATVTAGTLSHSTNMTLTVQ